MLNRIFVALLMALCWSGLSAGEMILLEEAAEFQDTRIRVASDGTGQISVKRCDECDTLKLRIDAGTQLEINGKKQPLQALRQKDVTEGTVFFNAETLRINRISASR